MILKELYVALSIVLSLVSFEINAQCWKASYGRGVGKPLEMCLNGTELNGALCYTKCKSGYLGNGPVCWKICKPGYIDYGLLCYRREFVYFKKCYNQSCSSCLIGYKEFGLQCKLESHIYIKESYLRDNGEPMKCNPKYEQNAGLCYDKCQEGFKGEGPICWLPCERTDYNFECGILCTANDEQCGLVTTNSVAAGLSMFAGILFSPLIITNSVYSSAVSASVATGSGAAWLTSSFLYESCNIRH